MWLLPLFSVLFYTGGLKVVKQNAGTPTNYLQIRLVIKEQKEDLWCLRVVLSYLSEAVSITVQIKHIGRNTWCLTGGKKSLDVGNFSIYSLQS